MIKVTQIEKVGEFIKYWQRLAAVMLKESPLSGKEQLLEILCVCYHLGALFAVRNDSGLCGVCAVEPNDNFSSLILRCIPNDKGTGVAKACIDAVKEWGHQNNYAQLEVTSDNFNGSSFRYFEKSLGFRRKFITFVLSTNK